MRHGDLQIVFLYGLCAVLWGYRWLTERSTYSLTLAAVWLIGAVIWFLRWLKSKEK